MKHFFILCFGFIVIGAGCSNKPTPPSPSTTSTSSSTTPAVTGWQSIDRGVEKLDTTVTVSSTGRLLIYRFAPTSTYAWHWENTTSAGTVADWMKSHPKAVLISNGVYFNEDYSPTGLMVIHRVRVGKRRFDDDKSGMIDLSSPVRIINTKQEPIDPKLMDQVAQSYPLLITNGEEAIKNDSGLVARRTFIGKDMDDNTYLGILTEPLSLFQCMKLLVTLRISWREVMNLDGGPSTGIASHFTNDQTTINSYVEVPNVIVIEKK